MNSFVLNTIVKDCWNATGKYFSATVRPTRVSKAGGSLHAARIARRFVNPPKTDILEPFFHYYQVGDIEPYLFSVNKFAKNEWVSVEKLMTDNEIFINIGLDNGIMLSPKDCWLKRAGIDRNYILAVYVNPMFNYGWRNNFFLRQEEDEDLILTEEGLPIELFSSDVEKIKNDLSEATLIMHFYTNPAYFTGLGRQGSPKVVKYTTNNPTTASAALSFLNQFADNIYTGWVLFNGMVSTLAYAKAHATDLAQRETAVYVDKTIEKKMWFRLSTTPVHYLSEGAGFTLRLGETGFYRLDDISLFIGTGTGSGFKGLNLDSSLEKFTYQISPLEIGIDARAIGLLRSQTNELDNLSNLYIYAVIRKNPKRTEKTYGLNAGRLELLNGLSLAERYKIFNGDYPALNHWKIDNFKHHPILQLTQSRVEDITDKMVVEGYGYSGVNRLFNPYPTIPTIKTKDGVMYQVFRTGSALREHTHAKYPDFKIEALVYDKTGKLIRSQFFNHDIVGYVAFKDIVEAKCAEMTLTKGYDGELRFFKKRAGNQTLDTVAKVFGFACYVTPSSNFGDWSLAQRGVHYNVVKTGNNTNVQWNTTVMNAQGLQGRVVFGGEHHHHITTMSYLKHGRDYAVLEILKDADNQLGVEPATIDVYHNDLLLIEGIDYIVQRGKIYIFKTSKTHDPVRVRLCGLSPTGKHLKPIDIGFTDQGRIGLGSKCRQMGYKQCQFNIGGRIYTADEIKLGNSGSVVTSIGDGVPYTVRQRVSSLEHYIDYSSVEAMQAEDQASTALYEALQAQYPINENRAITSVTDDRKYLVLSCLINEVLYQLRRGWLSSEIWHEYDRDMVELWLTPFADLLEADICRQPTFDGNFILVIAHDELMTVVTQQQLNFIRFVNTNFLEGRVRIDGYFVVGD